MTRTRGRKHDDPKGGTPWLLEIETAEMASWAYRAARNIIVKLGESIPPTGLQFTLGIDFLKIATQNWARIN